MARGRPRKTDAQKALDGNPGKRPLGGELSAPGAPERPKKLGKHAGWLWDLVVQEWMGRIDTAELIVLCNTWELLQAATIAALSDPLDKDSRLAYTAYKSEFDKLAGRFGLTPSDRAKIRLPVDAGTEVGEAKFFGVVG